MRYTSRQTAGQDLGRRLRDKGITADLVLGLPRGGVIVAAEVARLLHCPLDVLVVRKIGHPYHREFAVGALAEPDVFVLDKDSLFGVSGDRESLDRVIHEEIQRLKAYRARFHHSNPPDLTGKTVMLVDDGLATGATMEAAVLGARKLAARTVIVAVPVASLAAEQRLKRMADVVHAVIIDPGFAAVGQYYKHFLQTTDEEVLAVLRD